MNRTGFERHSLLQAHSITSTYKLLLDDWHEKEEPSDKDLYCRWRGTRCNMAALSLQGDPLNNTSKVPPQENRLMWVVQHLAVQLWEIQWCHLTWDLHMLMFCPVGILRRNFKGLPENHLATVSINLLSSSPPNKPWSTGRPLACCGLRTNPLETPEQVAHNPIQRNHPTCVQYKSQPSRIAGGKSTPNPVGLKYPYTIKIKKKLDVHICTALPVFIQILVFLNYWSLLSDYRLLTFNQASYGNPILFYQ